MSILRAGFAAWLSAFGCAGAALATWVGAEAAAGAGLAADAGWPAGCALGAAPASPTRSAGIFISADIFALSCAIMPSTSSPFALIRVGLPIADVSSLIVRPVSTKLP